MAMTIAGSDSGGGAGLAADLRTFAALGVHGVFAITVVTAQNTAELRQAVPIAPTMVGAQVDAVLDDLDVAAAKTGMLFTADNVRAVAARTDRLRRLVVDPVLVNSTGAPLVARDVVDAYRETLVPSATVLTPNAAEAALLTGTEVSGRADARRAAEMLQAMGGHDVVVTGLLVEELAVDVHAGPDGTRELVEYRIDTPNVHGSGCTFSAAIAARLSLGDDPITAIREAKGYVTRAIRSGAEWQLGSGHGPLDQLA